MVYKKVRVLPQGGASPYKTLLGSPTGELPTTFISVTHARRYDRSEDVEIRCCGLGCIFIWILQVVCSFQQQKVGSCDKPDMPWTKKGTT